MITVRACALASCTQSGLRKLATIASTTAPPASRAVTAAFGDQPASISDFAMGPDIPKVKADPIANTRPRRKFFWPAAVGVVVTTENLRSS